MSDNLTDEEFADMVQAQCSPAARKIDQLERELATARDLLRQVLEETVDRVPYPDGPCLDRETRAAIRRALE